MLNSLNTFLTVIAGIKELFLVHPLSDSINYHKANQLIPISDSCSTISSPCCNNVYEQVTFDWMGKGNELIYHLVYVL